MGRIFAELIEGLSRNMQMPLTPEDNKTITLLIEKKLRLQMEEDSAGKYFQVFADIADIPPGKFRENVLLYALMANVYPYTTNGTLAYSEKLGKLVLFNNFPLETLKAEVLFEFLPKFNKKALEWQEAIEGLNPAPNSVLRRAKKTEESNPFGIRP